MLTIDLERVLRRALILVALAALALGLALWGLGRAGAASWIWALGTLPVVAGLAISMLRDFAAGRVGVDAIALVSMAAALALGETLAGIVVAVMYAGGNVLEDFAVARAERDLRSLADRVPRSRIASATRNRDVPSMPWRSATQFWCAPARSCRWMV